MAPLVSLVQQRHQQNLAFNSHSIQSIDQLPLEKSRTQMFTIITARPSWTTLGLVLELNLSIDPGEIAVHFQDAL